MAKKNQGTVRVNVPGAYRAAGWTYNSGPQGTVAVNPAALANLGAAGKGVPRATTPPPAGTFGTPGKAPGQSSGATPQPYDPAVDQAAIIGGRNTAIANGDAAYQLGNLGFDYGYNPDGSVNTANPYSRAALYQLSYTNSKRGTTNGMAAQGQLYSGAYGTAQNLNDSNYARNEAANRLAYQRAIHGVQTGQLNTYANAGTGVSDADFAALLKATYPSGG